jgi:hypothetical protein
MLCNRPFTLTALFAPWLAAAWLLAAAPPAHAGCGCDHPPPAFAPVMPPFASPGHDVLIQTDGNAFQTGNSYQVRFSLDDDPISVTGTAVGEDRLKVKAPGGRDPGPASITVYGEDGFRQSFPSDLFTLLPRPPVVPVDGGALQQRQFQAAVARDGTLLIPFTVRHVQEAMQFAFELDGLTYAFGPDDVVFYNMDGVDLTLFTLSVDGQTQMQWGSYYGWEVEGDSGLSGPVYDTKVTGSVDPRNTSDVLTYWRHEFHSYTQAHLSGGSHVVDASGFHPDGTRHVNHGHLVLALSGARRQGKNLHPLDPGFQTVVLNVLAVPAENPIEPEAVESMLLDAKENAFGDFAPQENHFDEFQDMDSQAQNQGGE